MIFLNHTLNLTLLRRINSLILQILTLSTHAARSIHTLLQLIIPPSENVISVLSVASVVTVAEVERLGSIGGPLGLVVEGRRVPHDFVHELGNADRVRGGAAAAEGEEIGGAGGWVGYVLTVIGAIEVFAVPAAGGF
jgi:hypothetical protein